MKKKISSLFFIVLMMSTVQAADVSSEKRKLKSSMKEVYTVLPKSVESVSDLLSEGVWYGRLRFNSFGFRWKEDLTTTTGKALRTDSFIGAVGGSLIYKTAYFHGLGATAGLYMTEARGTLDDLDFYLYKGGKDTFSRYDLLTKNRKGIINFAQAYLEYKNEKISFKAGHLMFESFLTASNDTKMIPNTFEGVTLNSIYLSHTLIKLAFLNKQKLRDHSTFHHVLTRAELLADAPYHVYTQNDDSAMHIGLAQNKLAEAGIEDRLMIFDGKNQSVENLIVRANYTTVRKLISSAMLQADYKLKIGALTVIPALRYMQQFDNGAGAIGGANLKTITDGYSNPDSLNSWLLAGRVDVQQSYWKIRLGYTQVGDEGDIVAPWRGFPTAGFTRAMAQYNWYANTKTYMLRADYDFDKAGLLPEFKAFMRFAVQDFDDRKGGVQADSNVLTLDLLKEFDAIPGLYVKCRLAHVDGEDDVQSIALDKPFTKLDPSYDEVRFEINYLF